jgi:hypothetical protein
LNALVVAVVDPDAVRVKSPASTVLCTDRFAFGAVVLAGAVSTYLPDDTPHVPPETLVKFAAEEVNVSLIAEGVDVGVTAFDGAEAALVPAEFVAATVNVYDVPFVNPVTVAERADPVVVTD